jgi:hypothetical protein
MKNSFLPVSYRTRPCWRGAVKDPERGSISPLITIYFTIAMLMIFIVSNLASTYVARRELINTTEAALSLASQELDEFVYYYRIPIPDVLGSRSELVPINCSDAGSTFTRELTVTNNFENPPQILEFSCDGYVLTAKVKQQHRLPFANSLLPLESFTNRVQVTVQATFR